jgi:hypothetical protein
MYDEAAAQEAKEKIRQETNHQKAKIDAQLQSRLGQISNFALQRDSLAPGKELRAFFVVELPKSKGKERQIMIEVTVGDDTHVFRFREFAL